MTDPTKPSRCRKRSNWADLRAALAAGPKDGKWTWKHVGSYSTPGCAVFWPDTSKGGTHYRRLDSGGGMEQADAEFIVNADPATIRSLLADYDRMRNALWVVTEHNALHFGESHNTVIVGRAALAQEGS